MRQCSQRTINQQVQSQQCFVHVFMCLYVCMCECVSVCVCVCVRVRARARVRILYARKCVCIRTVSECVCFCTSMRGYALGCKLICVYKCGVDVVMHACALTFVLI